MQTIRRLITRVRHEWHCLSYAPKTHRLGTAEDAADYQKNFGHTDITGS